MNPDNWSRLEQRVVKAAEAALQDQKYVSPTDVLVGIGWLSPSTVAAWRQGRLPYLERGVTVNLHKTSTAMHVFRSWAVRHGLEPSEAAYTARTRDHRPLRFSASGQETIERSYEPTGFRQRSPRGSGSSSLNGKAGRPISSSSRRVMIGRARCAEKPVAVFC